MSERSFLHPCKYPHMKKKEDKKTPIEKFKDWKDRIMNRQMDSKKIKKK